MECPHLLSSVKINRDFVKNKKSEQSIISNSSSIRIWRCLECESCKENWLCLSCGTILCGRYEKSHALLHSGSHKNHSVCMNTVNYSVFCYACDDYIINDTELNNIDELRQEFKDDYDSASEASLCTEDSLLKSSSHQETTSTASSDSGWDEPHNGRKLRPRKRTMSSDSNESSSTNNTTSTNNGKVKNHVKKIKVVGLRNLGNTCFMNSVLQSLSNIQEFSCYFNKLPSLEAKNHKQRIYHSRSLKENCDDANVVEELRKVLLNLNQGGDGSKAISPECLFLVIWKVVPQFRGHRQHDAHEFLRYMLDRLHTELQHVPTSIVLAPDANTTAAQKGGGGGAAGGATLAKSIVHLQSATQDNHNFKGRSSIVTNVFGGTLQSEVRCLICGMESKKHDPFLDLSLDIPEKFYKDCDDESKAECNISDCLSSFTEVEELTETELYYCSSCKCKQKSTKRFWIRKLPNVLCLHIKRFRWNNFFRTKIDLRIKFPITSLDMSQYVLSNGPETRRSNSSNNIYDLAAVIVHHGNGSSCGHYTSFAINNGSWLHFNDHSVKEVSSSAVEECKPYILFYIRRNSSNSAS